MSTPIGNSQCTFWTIGNSLVPQEGPTAIFTALNFANADASSSFDLNELNLVEPSQPFSMIQCVYVDTSNTDAFIILTVQKSGQVIRVKGRTQGYYPIIAPNEWDLSIYCSDALAVVNLALLNYQVSPGQWSTL